jgi:hypothetical protein
MERDVAAELAFHQAMAAAQGNPIPMGNATVIQEEARDLWRFTFVENLWRDVVYGARSLRRSPALAATAVLSLGLGIGINTGIFSLGGGISAQRAFGHECALGSFGENGREQPCEERGRRIRARERLISGRGG